MKFYQNKVQFSTQKGNFFKVFAIRNPNKVNSFGINIRKHSAATLFIWQNQHQMRPTISRSLSVGLISSPTAMKMCV